jgi:hypothetical protein
MPGDGNAAKTLDNIREGANKMVLAVLCDIESVKREIQAGRFVAAGRLLANAHVTCDALARAEQVLGTMASSRMIEAGELEEGMVITGVGTVREVEECGLGYVVVRIEGYREPIQLGTGWMVMAENASES